MVGVSSWSVSLCIYRINIASFLLMLGLLTVGVDVYVVFTENICLPSQVLSDSEEY
jgi:hypothetical protein